MKHSKTKRRWPFPNLRTRQGWGTLWAIAFTLAWVLAFFFELNPMVQALLGAVVFLTIGWVVLLLWYDIKDKSDADWERQRALEVAAEEAEDAAMAARDDPA